MGGNMGSLNILGFRTGDHCYLDFNKSKANLKSQQWLTNLRGQGMVICIQIHLT